MNSAIKTTHFALPEMLYTVKSGLYVTLLFLDSWPLAHSVLRRGSEANIDESNGDR